MQKICPHLISLFFHAFTTKPASSFPIHFTKSKKRSMKNEQANQLSPAS